MRKHIRQQLLNSDDSQIVACLIEKNYPRLWSENKTVEASLLSIDFINYVRKGKVEKALEILSRPPLARPQAGAFARAQSILNENMFCEAHRTNPVQQSQAKIVSVDRRGAQIFLSPDELTKLFCFQSVWDQTEGTAERIKLSKHQSLDALMSDKHKEAIADYIDQ